MAAFVKNSMNSMKLISKHSKFIIIQIGDIFNVFVLFLLTLELSRYVLFLLY